MSPAKFHDDDDDQRCSRINFREMNGPRPSPLKINKDSHGIHKSYSSSSSTQQQQQRQPVIIYAHSPKIIHTQARDFMALVQKLTGFSPSDGNNKTKHGSHQKEAETLSMTKQQAILTEEKHDGGSRGGGAGVHLSSVSPITKPPTNPFLADVPLFTPTGTDFFWSPKSLFPNINPISPSVFEFMKGLPEY